MVICNVVTARDVRRERPVSFGARVVATCFLLTTAISAQACGGSAPPPAQQPGAVGSPSATSTPSPPPTPVQLANLSAGPAASDGVALNGDARSAYDRGFQLWASGDLSGARAAFSEAVAKAPGAGAPKYSLGSVLERMGDYQGAIDAYRAAFAADPKLDAAVGAYAVLLARTGHGPEAEQFLIGKRAQQPDSVTLLTELAEVKSIEGDSPGCQQFAQQALAKQPDSKEAMIAIARDYYRNHRWDLARYALQAILDGAQDGSIPARDPGNPVGLLIRALIERDSGQRKQAISDFEQAVARRPDLAEAYVNLGEMKLEAGNATEAQQPLERAVRYAPNLAIAHLDLGDCYRLLGRPGDAKRELDAALTMDSTLVGAHYDLGLLYLYSPSVPGTSGQDDQLAKAIAELQSYKSMRGAKAGGQGDDVDELLNTAKRKQSELQLKAQAASAPPASAAGSAVPASSAAPASSAGPASSAARPSPSASAGGAKPAAPSH